MIEREDIIADIIDRLWGMPEAYSLKLVSRDVKAIARVANLPAIFLVDVDDVVYQRNRLNNMRKWQLAIVSVISGTTATDAPAEIAEFQTDIKRLLYENNHTVGTTYTGAIYEISTSGLVFPAAGNNAIAQGMAFEIMYTEDIRRILPTE